MTDTEMNEAISLEFQNALDALAEQGVDPNYAMNVIFTATIRTVLQAVGPQKTLTAVKQLIANDSDPTSTASN